jgi:SAM-dependent methyltransferase
MTFFTTAAPQGALPRVGLSQHGRAGLELLGSLQKFSSGTLRPHALATFEGSVEGKALAAEHQDPKAQGRAAVHARVVRATALAQSDPLYRLERFFQRAVACDIWNRAIPAIEERRDNFEPLTHLPDGTTAGSLELNLELVAPAYQSEVEWHLEPGGWDGYDLYGPVFAFGIGPLVFRHGGYAAVGVDADITRQRIDAVRELPQSAYGRIYEPGCGGISTARAISTVFPDADYIGSDLSPLLLRNGHMLAERLGLKVALKQRDAAEDTGEPDASVDAVVTYALHHELPPKANAALFREMFRILKPGGDILLSDPPPFRAVSPFHAAILAWETEHREEPFFTVACLADWKLELEKAGFVDAEDYAIGKDGYPWITRARKPLDTEAAG